MCAETLWNKNLPLDQAVHEFTVGDDPVTDLHLLPWDIYGTAAHVRMLARCGFIEARDSELIVAQLRRLLEMHRRGEVAIRPEQEDCHTLIERFITENVGDAGKNVHLGRSRNDQIILAMRLYMRERIFELGKAASALGRAFLEFAERYEAVPLPGYTHMRRAMPSNFGMWASAFAEALAEEMGALCGVYARLDRCPLGSGAGFGVPLAIDREYVAELLGFSRVQRSVVDVQNSRGRHELALAGWINGVGNVLEKFLWDVAQYSTDEFGFIVLPGKFTTGSSIMPHKRNPDVIELARGYCGRLRALRNEIECVSTGLPSNYHRDLQLTKRPLVDVVGCAIRLLTVLELVVNEIAPAEDIAERAHSDELHAAARAYRISQEEKVPFRDAYTKVAEEILAGTSTAEADAGGQRHTGGIGRLGLDDIGSELCVESEWLLERSAQIKARLDGIMAP